MNRVVRWCLPLLLTLAALALLSGTGPGSRPAAAAPAISFSMGELRISGDHSQGFPTCILPDGSIGGASKRADAGFVPTFWEPDDAVTICKLPPGFANGEIEAGNKWDWFVGNVWNDPSGLHQACLWNDAGEPSLLGEKGEDSVANGINDLFQIIGDTNTNAGHKATRWVYDPTTNKWVEEPAGPADFKPFSSSGAAINNGEMSPEAGRQRTGSISFRSSIRSMGRRSTSAR